MVYTKSMPKAVFLSPEIYGGRWGLVLEVLLNLEVGRMSGQDDKFGALEKARRQYDRLIEVLKEANPGGDPYILLPPELSETVRAYEGLGAIYNSMNLTGKLERYWKEIYLPPNSKLRLRKKLKEIVDIEVW